MKRSLRNALITNFITLAISIRWLTYLRSRICQCEGHADQLTEISQQVVSFVGDAFLTRDDSSDSRARASLRQLLSASAEDIPRAERCLRDVGFPESCTQLAMLCSSSLDVRNSWRDISGALNILADTLSARLIEIAATLYRENELETAYISLKEHLLENGDSPDRTEKFVAQVKDEIFTNLHTKNIA